MSAPYWPLARVKAIAAKRDGLFIMKGRARAFLTPELCDCHTNTDAYLFVRGVICDTLAEEHFSETVPLDKDTADIYALYVGADPWYIKLCIDEDQPEVVVISFHPPEGPIRTRAGTVNPK